MRNASAGSRSARQSNIELLRIFAMIAIIANHSVVHGHVLYPPDTISVNRLWFQLIQIPGFCGVDAFVLISGFFLVSARSLKTTRIVKLWAQIFFYSVLLYIVFVAAGAVPFSLRTLIARLTPVTSCRWWFASTYFVLYLLSPFLNRLLNAFDKKQYLGFLAMLFLLWCVIPTLEGTLFQSFELFQNNHLAWFVFLYALGAFLRRFPAETGQSGARLIALSVLCMLAVFLTAVVLDVLGRRNPVFAQHALFLADLQTIPSLISAVLLFLGFSRLDIGSRKAVNFLSSAMFGVYLIHDDTYVSPFLWERLFRSAAYAESPLFIPRSLLVIAAVFAVCTLIELARIRLIEKPCMPLIEGLARRIDRLGDALLSGRILGRFGRE
ncbi:MAG: acyltransferase [Oscillospiraceae bacterium]|nr:acyltransferase [Oscillospiraceae bacterium]